MTDNARLDPHGGDVYTRTGVTLDFSININPLGMPEEVLLAAQSAIIDCDIYPDPHCARLAARLSKKLGVPTERIALGNGASDVLFRLCLALRPDRALTAQPGFSDYQKALSLCGSGFLHYYMEEARGFAFDERFLDCITPGLGMAVICTPNNPTGRLAPLPLLEKAAEKCRNCGAYLLLDESFIGFTEGGSFLPLAEKYGNVIILRAFTKLYAMAGLRLGYAVLPDARLARLVKETGQSWSVSTPAQAAGLAALSLEGWQERTLDTVKKERAFMTKGLSALGVKVYPSDANFLLIKSQTPLFAPLLEKGILIRRCGNFTGLDDTFYRIGLKQREANARLLDALKGILG